MPLLPRHKSFFAIFKSIYILKCEQILIYIKLNLISENPKNANSKD